MSATIDAEIAALHRMAIRRLPSSRVAAARVRIKRRLRLVAMPARLDTPTRDLIDMVRQASAAIGRLP